MMKNIMITSCIFLLMGCLPLEPIPTGIFSTYNFCSNPIELRNDDIPHEYYKKEKGKIMDINTHSIGLSYSDESLQEQAKKAYFIENGIRKHFQVDIYKEHRVNLIACPENAKPTGDGNWIKAN